MSGPWDDMADSNEREQNIVEVLVDAFEDLIDADPRAFRRKFRKMAQDLFSFFCGIACLFFAVVVDADDRYDYELTS